MRLIKPSFYGIAAVGLAVSTAFASSCDEVRECEFSAECPPASGECFLSGCFDGTCAEVPASAGANCSVGKCDGKGSCGCDLQEDCEALGDECNTVLCVDGQCVREPVEDGFACDAANPCADSTCQAGNCVPSPLPEGAPCSLGGECAPPAACSGGECVETPGCEAEGVHESNDTQDTAFALATIGDCDEFTLCDSFMPGEEDWYVYSGVDEECEVHATVELSGAGVEVCQYWACVDPDLTTDICPPNTVPAEAPNGQPGCCGVGAWFVDPCNGDVFDNGSATVWLQVKGTAEECSPYTLYMEF